MGCTGLGLENAPAHTSATAGLTNLATLELVLMLYWVGIVDDFVETSIEWTSKILEGSGKVCALKIKYRVTDGRTCICGDVVKIRNYFAACATCAKIKEEHHSGINVARCRLIGTFNRRDIGVETNSSHSLTLVLATVVIQLGPPSAEPSSLRARLPMWFIHTFTLMVEVEVRSTGCVGLGLENAPAHTSATAGLTNLATLALVLMPLASGLSMTSLRLPSSGLPKY